MMTNADFSHILQYPEALIQEQALDLKSILEEFPYFQAARALYLKALKTNESFRYNQELKITAAYTTDRSILFNFITSEAFLQNEISLFIKKNTTSLKDIEVDVEDISVTNNTIRNNTFSNPISRIESILDPELFQPKEVTPTKLVHFTEEHSKAVENTTKEDNIKQNIKAKVTTEKTKKIEKTPESILELGKPLDFNNKETRSFNEWLKLSTFTPIDRSKEVKNVEPEEENLEPKKIEEKKPSPEQAKKFALIDKFISTNPKINPKKSSGVPQNLAETNLLQPESLMTETLARIYVEQKNYKKAIQSYNILILKYPEKSGYFADRIKAIKQIQEQNKKN